jgi:hypothetical protein
MVITCSMFHVPEPFGTLPPLHTPPTRYTFYHETGATGDFFSDFRQFWEILRYFGSPVRVEPPFFDTPPPPFPPPPPPFWGFGGVVGRQIGHFGIFAGFCATFGGPF